MLKNISKAIAGVGMLSAVFSFQAVSGADTPLDTTRKLQYASASPSKHLIVLKEANVQYPEIFSGSEAHTLDYIEKFASRRRSYLTSIYQRSRKLFPKAAAILSKYDVPEEFRILLALESNFNANAVSHAGAVGYWQFMDDVAKEYGLRIAGNQRPAKLKDKHTKGSRTTVKNKQVDDRKNFVKSTHAAARYLRDRAKNLSNDWLLMAAAYNWGVGNVWNAMERTGKANPTFWDIRKQLPAETRAYVMNFITLNVIFKNYEAFANNTLCFRDVTCEAVSMEEVINEYNSTLISE